MDPQFLVPAEYLYALTAELPPQLTPEMRFRIATSESEERLLESLELARERGIIVESSTINFNQAARRLVASGSTQGLPEALLSSGSSAHTLVTAWLAFDDAEIDDFWPTANPVGHLFLVLAALTARSDSQAFVDALAAFGSGVNSVEELVTLTRDDWFSFFEPVPGESHPNQALLPDYTRPGTLHERIDAFLRRLSNFFDITVAGLTVLPETAAVPPTFDVSGGSPLEAFVVEYNAIANAQVPADPEFALGIDPIHAVAAAAAVFPDNRRGQQWLVQRLTALNELYLATAPLGLSDAERFSVMEALYARGYLTQAAIAELSEADFEASLAGTVAHQYATQIHTSGPTPAEPGPHRPVNPDGSLVNCIPPDHLSPLGPVAYLNELLGLSAASTCDEPGAGEAPRLATQLSTRRGPLHTLEARRSNLETALPLIDLVNECLEAMADTEVDAGVVHQTASSEVAGHALKVPGATPTEETEHDPAVLLESLPEHSSPATVIAHFGAYTKLRQDFSTNALPYSQPLDVSRSYLAEIGTSRFETMRRFRADITEFVLAPEAEPGEFSRHLWRYPVRFDLAREYLGINPEEDSVFRAPVVGNAVAVLYGFPEDAPDWATEVRVVSTLLERTGMSYCELRELIESGWIELSLHEVGSEAGAIELPRCEPCCLRQLRLVVDDSMGQAEALRRLAVFIRMWHKLQRLRGARYSFEQLSDIATVLDWFPAANQTSSEFVRQLAAFQMLRDELGLALVDPCEPVPDEEPSGAERTHLLALWVGAGASKRAWAVEQLIARVGEYAQRRFRCGKRPAKFLKLLESNLDALSALAGFDPLSADAHWDTLPTHTLRFAELLAKIYASRFGIGEILFSFTSSEQLPGDSPLPLSSDNEAAESPLDLPDDDAVHSLWELRKKLLAVDLEEDEIACWSWPRIVVSMQKDFGFEPGDPDALLELGQHFFPSVVTPHGMPLEPSTRQYRAELLPPTSAGMWNTPVGGPFFYDEGAQQLVSELPLSDEAVLHKFSRIRQLEPSEQVAVQHLYFAPRIELARFAFLFPNFAEAEQRLIEEPDETKRWMYFQRAFALVYARSRLIAEHLAEHVSAATGMASTEGSGMAWLVLAHLLADENRAPTNWEHHDGTRPDVIWGPSPSGGAFAALLGLLGTGLLGQVRQHGGDALVYREFRAPMDAFGATRNAYNAPFPTLVPAFEPDESLRFVTVRNGFAVQNDSAEGLGGARGFSVIWTGVLLVEESGGYVFRAGGGACEGESHAADLSKLQSWHVTLKRGQKTWRVVSHERRGKESNLTLERPLQLKRGAYDLVIEFEQCPPAFDCKDPTPTRTGFRLEYSGPDTQGELVAVPAHRLFIATKDGLLDDGIDVLPDSARSFLRSLYRSSLRDVRRTYQRAFKALLLSHRLTLSAKPEADSGQSELGYLLAHPVEFQGLSFFPSGGSYLPHRAQFDFNFLPVGDNYHPPTRAQDDRVEPALERQQASFDWWERLLDYVEMREATRDAPEAPAWLLFHEAAELHEDNPAHLLRHLGVDLPNVALVLRFYDGVAIGSSELSDERWTLRAWRADVWISKLLESFFVADVTSARPDWWVAPDPGANAGNQNLLRFVEDGFLENGRPARYADLKRLNDGLRERARRALVAYLTSPAFERVGLPQGGFARNAKHLSELLLLDMEAGLRQRASRIEEAVSAVQSFVQRGRLGLEPAFTPGVDFRLLWDRSFADLGTWRGCVRQRLYRENFIEGHDRTDARRSESFRFFEDQLRGAGLTVAAPSGVVNWAGPRPPTHPKVQLLQAREPSVLRSLPQPTQGLTLLGIPDRHARPAWLSAPPLLEGGSSNKLPYWIEAAIRQGVEFLRVAASGVPMGAATFDQLLHDGEHGCCVECGVSHPPVMDEYYFWLLDTRHFEEREQDADVRLDDGAISDPELDGSDWRNATKAPKLLSWQSEPMLHLVWARVHNGELKQVRRSSEGVAVPPGVAPKFRLVGRFGDSLRFELQPTPLDPQPRFEVPPGHESQPNPGFRYDLVADSAVTLPPVLAEATAAPSFLGLSAYPYFLFFTPGAPLVPVSLFSQATSAAGVLRAHCRFEAALGWYEAFFSPRTGDTAWCADDEEACCTGGAVDAEAARRRAATLGYLETLFDWGDALMRRRSPEAFQQARLIFDSARALLGERPRTVSGADSATSQTIETFTPAHPPLNPRLLSLYERVDDRLTLIHDCLDARRLPTGKVHVDIPYFGDGRLRDGWQVSHRSCIETQQWCVSVCPYRFVFLIQRAIELAREVQGLGGALLAAYEKGDAEYLASLRASHERQLLELALEVRQNQWRDADWQVQALQKTKEIAQTRRRYFQGLIDIGLIAGEVDYRNRTNSSIAARTAANIAQGASQLLHLVPDIYVGFPISFTHLPTGSKLAAVFSVIATISNTVADIEATTAGLRLTEASWDRRETEWRHQVEVLDLEIEQIERQLLGAERRRDVALRELNNHQRQLEQASEVLDFLSDKFTSHELYLWLQRETAALYYQMYELAFETALKAQRAFNFELGHQSRDFIGEEPWDDLHAGLLSGERLVVALRRMEKVYTDENRREYEIVKQVSLRDLFPIKLLQLRTAGVCEVDLPEWLFDLDYPGHYMRRIKCISLSIPTVLGPFTSVNCRLILLSSETRVDPRLSGPVAVCCDEPRVDPETDTCACCGFVHHRQPGEHAPNPPHNGYPALSEDPRIVKLYGATEAIATSTAQDDSGLFELNFRDERYLPFEFHGAVSRWRIELPPENNYFDVSKLTDVVLQLRYMAREGGEALRRAAREAALDRLPDSGQRVIDVERELPDAWHRFAAPARQDARRTLELPLERDFFPYLPGRPKLRVVCLEFLFELAEDSHERDKCGGRKRRRYASKPAKLSLDVTLPEVHGRQHDEPCKGVVHCVQAVASGEWPNLYHGVLEVRLAPVRDDRPPVVHVAFPKQVRAPRSLFLVVGYEASDGVQRWSTQHAHV